MNTHEQNHSMPPDNGYFAYVCSHGLPVDDVDAFRFHGRYRRVFLASVYPSASKLCGDARHPSSAHSVADSAGHLASGALSSQTHVERCRAALHRLFLYRTTGQMGHRTHLCPSDKRAIAHVAFLCRNSFSACVCHHSAYMENGSHPRPRSGNSSDALQWKLPVLSGDSPYKSFDCIDSCGYSRLVVGRAALHQNDPINHASKKNFSKALARLTLVGRQFALPLSCLVRFCTLLPSFCPVVGGRYNFMDMGNRGAVGSEYCGAAHTSVPLPYFRHRACVIHPCLPPRLHRRCHIHLPALTRFFSGASQSPFFFPRHHQWRDCVARMEARTQVVSGGAA